MVIEVGHKLLNINDLYTVVEIEGPFGNSRIWATDEQGNRRTMGSWEFVFECRIAYLTSLLDKWINERPLMSDSEELKLREDTLEAIANG